MGRAHGLSSQQLYKSSLRYADERDLGDPDHFAFNGIFSLSVFYLIGLGLELMLKAAIVLNDDQANLNFLKNDIGHNLKKALEVAVEKGFTSNAPYLTGVVNYMSEPYRLHHFRYEPLAEMPLPEMAQIIEMFAALDEEFEAIFGIEPQTPSTKSL
jgi:hypothetical protein